LVAATPGHVPVGDVSASVSRRINAERLVLLAWARAILLQLAHPLIAAGVHEHSGFRQSPAAAISRLHHTVRSMLALAFGDDEAREHALETIRGIHRRVHGTLASAVGPFGAGTPYSAEDPALLLWVHATLLDSVPLVYEQIVHGLTDEEHDRYCVEAAPIAVALGARDADVPRTRADLRAYMESVYRSGQIVVGRDARELARAVMRPRGRALVAPAAWVNDLLTVGLLPDPIRRQYGFDWTPRRGRALSVALRGLRAVRRATPDRVALWKDARKA